VRAARVALSRSCNQACAFCEVADELDRRPLEAAEVRASIDAAVAAGAEQLVLTGGEPTLSAHLVKAVGYARGRGLRTALSTNGRLLADPARLGRVVAAGLDAVHVGLHGARPETHVALVGGDPLAHAQAVAALEACAAHFETTLRTVLTRSNAAEVPDLIALAARLGVRFELRRLLARGAARSRPDLLLDPADALDALEDARVRAAALGVPFSAVGFDALGLLDRPAPGAPVPLDDARRARLASGLVDRRLLAGLALPDDDGLAWLAGHLKVPLADVGHAAAARRLPIVDLDPSLGGRGDAAPAALGPARPLPARRGATRIAVVVDDTADPLLARSTLPGLHHELLARGARSTLHTLFRAPHARDAIPPLPAARGLGRLAGLLRPDDRPLHPGDDVDLAAAEARWRARLDLSDVDVVVVPSARTAARLRALRPDARFVVLDHGLLDGFDGRLGPDDVLVSPLPAAFRVYALAGVPLNRVHWRPAPTHLPHVPLADPGASSTVILAGGDAVDLELVRATWPADAGLRLLRLDVDAALGEPVPTDPAARLAAVGGARLVWLPVRPVLAPAVARAASLALACGRPLVASETPLVADHARPADARLLRPEAADHRDALRALAADDAAVRALAPTEARRAVAGTARLAAELHEGAPPERIVSPFAPAGPWWCW
jgi:pyruvate-formate lyase-activating enzyme